MYKLTKFQLCKREKVKFVIHVNLKRSEIELLSIYETQYCYAVFAS